MYQADDNIRTYHIMYMAQIGRSYGDIQVTERPLLELAIPYIS